MTHGFFKLKVLNTIYTLPIIHDIRQQITFTLYIGIWRKVHLIFEGIHMHVLVDGSGLIGRSLGSHSLVGRVRLDRIVQRHTLC